ncbi:hypothetical protein A1A1_08199 [Planococcus antarcticus DSM 14505]|uniref:Uncharacterized protein n=1 Tax=Planococcus antarcticus DSM 14505 TaxID=1185653 RepID=A0AA87IM31_9BACL|nr:hypothetical protein [Planococcus antarcticus]EIM06934.1 hypothetical protein A1A1_08199 [Planococcus antarcticus DSM 14505]
MICQLEDPPFRQQLAQQAVADMAELDWASRCRTNSGAVQSVSRSESRGVYPSREIRLAGISREQGNVMGGRGKSRTPVQPLQFTAIGISNAAIDIGSLNLPLLLHPTDHGVLLVLSNTIAYCLAMGNSYL